MSTEKRPPGKVIAFPGKRVRPIRSEGAAASEMQDAPGPPADTEKKKRGIIAAIVHFKARSGLVRKAIGLLPRWITPNGVTIFRGLLIAPIVLLMSRGMFGWALLTLAFAMLLDFVDGALATVRNMASEAGAFLDPLADKVLVCGVLIAALPHLPDSAWMPVVAICASAVALTVFRIVKVVRNAGTKDGPAPKGARIAASSTGKMKLLTETASMFLVLGGLALGSGALVWAGVVALCAAAVLGGLSLASQLRR